jgi:hypothetical protein
MVTLKGVASASVQVVEAKGNVKSEYRNCCEGEDPNGAAEHGNPHFC